MNNNKTDSRYYIVEAPVPLKGQVVSSGGIRENGRIAVQFKNPVPYEEPQTQINRYYIHKNVKEEFKDKIKYEATCMALEIGFNVASSIWHDCLKPVCKDLMKDCYVIMSDNLITTIKSKDRAKLKANEIIEQKNKELSTYENDNILYFPQKKIV